MVSRSYKSILLSTIILGTSFGANNVFATDPEVDFSVTINPSLSLSVSSNTVNLPITPDVDGEYNTTNFTITSATNNMYGYTLTMSTEDNHTYLESTAVDPISGTKPQIQSLASSQDGISAATFEAATTEANGLNRWGIAIGSGNYNAVTSPKQVKKTTTNNASGVDNTTVNIAAKLNLAVPAGTYKNKFIIQMVANPLPGGLEEAYQNAGKTKATINGKEYYAMQDMTPEICINVDATGDVIEVYDNRDNTIYHIGKLNDGNCWLLDNLALDAVANGSSLTPQNTNATQAAIDNYRTSSGTAPQTGWTTDAVSYQASHASYDTPLLSILNASVVPQGSLDPLKELTNTEQWKVGIYYNYCAASIGTYCYAAGNGVDKDYTAIDADQDICPAGWRMPTGGPVGISGTSTEGGGEYQYLYNSYYWSDVSMYTNLRTFLRLPLSGDLYYGSVGGLGSYGYFWSSTYFSDYGMYDLKIDTSDVDLLDVPERRDAISVRCIAKTGTEPAPSGN